MKTYKVVTLTSLLVIIPVNLTVHREKHLDSMNLFILMNVMNVSVIRSQASMVITNVHLAPEAGFQTITGHYVSIHTLILLFYLQILQVS